MTSGPKAFGISFPPSWPFDLLWRLPNLKLFDSAKGEELPFSAFCRTSVGEWDAFRSIDMDAEERVRNFIEDTSDKDVLVLNVQDPFQRLLLHGVCEFYNVTSTTSSSVRDGKPWKTTTIKKRSGAGAPSRITLVSFLRMKKNRSQ
ncbi:hypothetical protein BAE44_0007160 [Dichanthelium oligosanthes]|uniref:R3H-associated N-terminal domain-containing protein n=1 Tax=Dichanthelium oligosanthes TaxID=888268 RepID=A0A1E5W3G4_9POAL|nr:hypothetical protein BAE44_0007160 [Dichanthelium oligosanthes]